VTINRGDVYLVQGVASDFSNDLTGSLIESDEPIAVLSGHVRTEMPHDFRSEDDTSTTSRNHLVEQMPPVSAWGDSALVVPYAASSLPDLVRVVSSSDGNTISFGGNECIGSIELLDRKYQGVRRVAIRMLTGNCIIDIVAACM